MSFDLQALKSCGFKVFNFIDESEKTALRLSTDLAGGRRPRSGAKGRRAAEAVKREAAAPRA